jgi:hypothetical protein
MRIAIVGNGKLKKNYGKQIDSCDFVIRFNRAKIKGYEKQRGTKTSTLALVGETSLSYNQAIDKLDRDIIRAVQYVLFSAKKRNEDYEKEILKIKGSGNIIFAYIGYEYFVNLSKIVIGDKWEMEKIPSTGINILAYLIANNNMMNDGDNEYFIYGFDCFETGHYYDTVRNNSEFHDIDTEKAIIAYLKQHKNLHFF